MTPGRVDLKVVANRVRAVRRMVVQLQALAVPSLEEFRADFRSPATAESLLRRAIEALLDVARYLLARATGSGHSNIGELPVSPPRRGWSPTPTCGSVSSRLPDSATGSHISTKR